MSNIQIPHRSRITLVVGGTLLLGVLCTTAAWALENGSEDQETRKRGFPGIDWAYRERTTEDVGTARAKSPACVPGADDSCGGSMHDNHTTDPPTPALDPTGAPATPVNDNAGGTASECAPTAPTAPVADDTHALQQFAVTIGINPTHRGLTGLDTWLWAANPPDALTWTQTGTAGTNPDCTPRPAPTTTFTATVNTWRFVIRGDDDHTTYTAPTAGSEARPAATHMFDRTGTYTIELHAHLNGAINRELPVATTTYDVIEVRSRLIH